MRAAPTAQPANELPSSSILRWFTPDEDVDMILSGACGDAVHTLSRELRRIDDFLRAGVDPPTRVLFAGPSGTGKTMAARWIARRIDAPIAIADVSQMNGRHMGDGTGALRDVFATVARVPRAVLFLDEIDAICIDRSGAGNGAASTENARTTTAFFQQIDWLPPARIVFGATNFADELDPALRRRLTTEIVFEAPDREGRRRMLETWLGKAPIAPEQLDKLADDTEGLAGAELRARAMAMARRAVMAQPDPSERFRVVINGPVQTSLDDVEDDMPSKRRRSVDPDRAEDSEERAAKLLKMLNGFGDPLAGTGNLFTKGARR